MIYTLNGKVVKGKGIGHLYDMPTANIETCDPLPPLGVYGGLITVDGQQYICITNVGTRPTVDDNSYITIESLIFDFSGNIYNHEVSLQLHFYLRDIRKFDSMEQLYNQLMEDKQNTLKQFKQD